MTIHWNLTHDEAQAILNILAQRPYIEIATIISKLAQQTADSQPRPPLKAVDSGQESAPAL